MIYNLRIVINTNIVFSHSTEVTDISGLSSDGRYTYQTVRSCLSGPSCSDPCPEGKFGPKCIGRCDGCDDTQVCDHVTGECICKPGKRGHGCAKGKSALWSADTLSRPPGVS